MTLYSLRHDGDQYRITKLDNDLNPESSYLMTAQECECPAGHRATCRHRQMFPSLLPIVNTHWFLDWDGGKVIVDANGTLKDWIDRALVSPVAEGPHSEPAVTPEQAQYAMAQCDYWNGRKSLSAIEPASPPSRPWRRM